VPPNGRYSCKNDWRETSALGPRVSKLAPFLREFSEPPREATEWESAPSGYLKSCRSRFSSVSSGDSAASPSSPGEKTMPFCATWKGIFAHHPSPLFPRTLQRECAHLCNVDGDLLPQPLSYREWVRLCNVGRHLLMSFSPLLSLLPPDTPGSRLIRRGIDSPHEPRRAVRPCLVTRDLCRALCSATRPCLTSRDLRRVHHPATCTASYVLRPATAPCSRPAAYAPPDVPHSAPGVVLTPLRPTVPLPPRLQI
jgi:hypothetical protein